MNKLAADINLLVIVRRDREGKRPDKAILHVRRRRAVGLIRPNFNAPHLPVAQIKLLDDAADTSRTRSAGPHDIRIHRIRRRPTTLAAADRLPRTAWNRSAAERPAWTAIRRIVLLVAVDVIRNTIVDRHVIHLRDRQLNAKPRLT